MNNFFNQIFTWANFWSLVRVLVVCVVLYMAWGFLYPLAVRAGGTASYVVTEMPAEAGNWIADKVGLKGSRVTKNTTPTATTPTEPTTPTEASSTTIFPAPEIGGPQHGQPTSVALGNAGREEILEADKLRHRAQKKLIWANTFAQGEAQELAFDCGDPHPARNVAVTVYDQNNKRVLVTHKLLVDRKGETEPISVSPNSTKNLEVGYGPLRFKVGAQVPGAGFSDFKAVEFAANEVGEKVVQLHVTMPLAEPAATAPTP